ncbi:LysR family transcriptional regulator [Novosphingobium terrae]|uniref:LysR family transcriptional regulator n=1 Tax=Novosphingobium terrae TaxID=2726189 RepID=UPI00198137CF|nr:LysR family transcriptional regulator [Novosphingobium terrae]
MATHPLSSQALCGTSGGFHPATVDLNLLRILAVVLNRRNVTGAAEHLGMSQPAVSRSLARLRNLFGDPLLIRANGRMQLTHYAQCIAEPLTSWLEGVSSLVSVAPFVPETLTRRFRIATSDYGALTVVGSALGAVMKQAPHAAIDILPLSRDSYRALAAGDVDLILTGGEADPTQHHQRQLFEDDLVCVMAPDHPWAASAKAASGRMALTDYLECPHIALAPAHDGKDAVEGQGGAIGKAKRVVMTLPYAHLAPAMLTGSLVATVPRRLAMEQNCGLWRIVEAPKELGHFTYRALWSERSRGDQALSWLIDLLAQTSQKPALS